MGQNGAEGQEDGEGELDDDLGGGVGTSTGRKKGSWLAWTYFLQRKVEKVMWKISRIARWPSICCYNVD